MVEIVSDPIPVAASAVQGGRTRSTEKVSESQGRGRGATSLASADFESRRKSVSEEELKDVVSQAQELLNQTESRIQLAVDRDLQQVVIKVIDRESGQVIRQIPPEEMLELQRFFQDRSGLLLSEEA